MKTEEINCVFCGKSFLKEVKEIKRKNKKGKFNFFCSLSCSVSSQNKSFPRSGNIKNLIRKKKDQYTPFRWYLLRAKARNKIKKYGCDITVDYLHNLWECQNGICPFTKWKLILPNGTFKSWEVNSPFNASLDRIDSSKGYIKGNVRFISVMANYAKNTFTDDQLIEFCKAVANN